MKRNILLLHGWDYMLYSKMTKSSDAWAGYKKLMGNLEKKYNVYKLNLPGFCGEKEPKDKEWNVKDFSKYVEEYITNNNLKIDIILGYSFGGAVAVDYKNRYNSDAKLFLVAPAIIRNADNSKNFAKTPAFLKPLRNILRNLYVIYVVQNNEMKYGTSFLRNSYQLIVREDERRSLEKINPKDVCIIYGTKDTAVDPQKMLDTVDKKYIDSINLVDNADHDDIITKYEEDVVEILNKFDSKNRK